MPVGLPFEERQVLAEAAGCELQLRVGEVVVADCGSVEAGH